MRSGGAATVGWLGIAVVAVALLAAPATGLTPDSSDAAPTAVLTTPSAVSMAIPLAVADSGEWPTYATVIVAVGGTLLLALGFVVEARDRRRRAESVEPRAPDEAEGAPDDER